MIVILQADCGGAVSGSSGSLDDDGWMIKHA
jgi:hypothetical protein